MTPNPRLVATLNINLGGLHGAVQRKLQHLVNSVGFGLRAAQSFSTEEVHLPDTMIQHQFSGVESAWDPQSIRDAFGPWVLTCGLRDAIEIFSAAVEEARAVLAAWSLGSGAISGPQWNSRMVVEARRFHRLGLPDKFPFLTKQYGFSYPSDKLADLLSINKARNCLVHRSGVVAIQDVDVTQDQASAALEIRRTAQPTEPWGLEQLRIALTDAGFDPTLRVTWLRLELVSGKDGTIQVLDPRETPMVEAGSQIALRLARRSKAFALGDRVAFDSNEFAELAFSLVHYAQTLSTALEEHGRSQGVPFAPPGEGGA